MSFISDNTAADRAYAGNDLSRIPSPTPSEVDLLKNRSAKILSGFHKPTKRPPWYSYVILIFILAIVILLAVFQKNIVHWLEPAGRKIKNLPAGFLVPVAVLVIISFPPLFGQEIVAVLVGVVWGLWPGFAIVCAGTIIGEVLSFYAFKFWIRGYGEALEEKTVQYAALARIIRDGGLVVAVVTRYSVVPNHFVTALFAVCGVRFWVFFVSAILSLPLHLVTVFLGKALADEDEGKDKSLDNIVTYTTLAATILVTYAAVFYLGNEIDKIKEDLVLQRRISRRPKVSTAEFSFNDASRAEMGPSTDALPVYGRPEYGRQYPPANNRVPVATTTYPPPPIYRPSS